MLGSRASYRVTTLLMVVSAIVVGLHVNAGSSPTVHAASYVRWVAQTPTNPSDSEIVHVYANSDTVVGDYVWIEYYIGPPDGSGTNYRSSQCHFDTSYTGANWDCDIPGQIATSFVKYQLYLVSKGGQATGWTNFNWNYTVRYPVTTPHTIAIDGTCADWNSGEEFLNKVSGTETWLTWDAANIYVAWLGGGSNSQAQQRVIAFDLDPGTQDTAASLTYSGASFPSQLQPEYVVQVQSNTSYLAQRNGGTWTSQDATNILNRYSDNGCRGNAFVEAAIPRSALGGLSSGSGMAVMAYFNDPNGNGGNGYVYGTMPDTNGSGNAPFALSSAESFLTTDDGQTPRTFGQVIPPFPASTPTPAVTSTQTSTPQPTATVTNTPVSTDTPTRTATPTLTATVTDTAVPTDTVTGTPMTPTSTDTPVPTETQTATSTPSPTITPTSSSTVTPTTTDTPIRPTNTPVPTDTSTPVPTLTLTPTATLTPLPAATATNTSVIVATIQWNGLFADQSPFFMSPVEVAQGGTLKLRFRTGHGDVTSLNVNYYDTATPVTGWGYWIPMNVIGQDATGKYDIWQADASSLLATASTKYYRFQVNKGPATTWYNAYGPTCGTQDQFSCTPPETSNFWVIPGFHTPKWSTNAIFYQVFVDRFRNGNAANDIAYHSSKQVLNTGKGCPAGSYDYDGACAFMHKSWSELPINPGHAVDFFGGDLAGIAQELQPYIRQQVGANALYLSPIFTSPSNHKYDTQNYNAVDPHFGTNTSTNVNSLTNLTAAVHKLGMSILLDGVFNHTGDWNCWFNRPQAKSCSVKGAWQDPVKSPFANWYRFKSSFNHSTNPGDYCSWSGFGNLPQLNYSSAGVRDAIYRGTKSVMRNYLAPPYNIDGWRLDVADNYSDLGNLPANQCATGVDNHPIWQEIRSYFKGVAAKQKKLSQFPESLILGEFWQVATPWLGGDQWDSVMNYNGFNAPISRFFTHQDVHGENFGTVLKPTDLNNWLRGTLADNNHSSQLAMLNSLSTHDTSRFLYRACTGTGASSTVCAKTSTTPATAFAKLMMATELQMTYVGMPSIYYGDEIGTTGANDPDNRRPFDWTSKDWNTSVLHLTHALATARSQHEAWRDGSFLPLVTDDTNNVFAYGRFLLDPTTIGKGIAPSDAAIVALNNDSSSHNVTIDAMQLSLRDGTTLKDVAGGGTYTVSAGTMSVLLAGNTGAVLVVQK